MGVYRFIKRESLSVEVILLTKNEIFLILVNRNVILKIAEGWF